VRPAPRARAAACLTFLAAACAAGPRAAAPGPAEVPGAAGARAPAAPVASAAAAPAPRPADPAERRLANVRQLTFGGENAEAYFSHDGRSLTFQSTRDGRACDQQYVVNVDGTGLARVSDGRGKTTCGWFLPGDQRLFFASTSHAGADCPRRPDPSKGTCGGSTRSTCTRRGATARACGA
jgi:dipeptidyl aminopeptidase/acylaminoacyl peptidase